MIVQATIVHVVVVNQVVSKAKIRMGEFILPIHYIQEEKRMTFKTKPNRLEYMRRYYKTEKYKAWFRKHVQKNKERYREYARKAYHKKQAKKNGKK